MVPECKPEWNREAITVFSRLPSLRRLQATPLLQTSLVSGENEVEEDLLNTLCSSHLLFSTDILPLVMNDGEVSKHTFGVPCLA